jgi:hypothetical protein
MRGDILIFFLCILALVGILTMIIKSIVDYERKTPQEKIIRKVIYKNMFKKQDFDQILEQIKKGFEEENKKNKLRIRKQKLKKLNKI